MNTIKITVETLEKIIADARMLKDIDSSLSDTIEISLLRKSDTHTGEDLVSASVLCEYAECAGTSIMII